MSCKLDSLHRAHIATTCYRQLSRNVARMIAVGGVVNYKDDDGIVAMMMAAMCHVIIHEFRRREITRLAHQMLIQLGPRLKRHCPCILVSLVSLSRPACPQTFVYVLLCCESSTTCVADPRLLSSVDLRRANNSSSLSRILSQLLRI